MKLKAVDRKEQLAKEQFAAHYLNVGKPVVFTELSHQWPAYKKWDLTYFEEIAGNVKVPLYDSEPAKGNENSHKPACTMPMKAYMQLLKNGPTDLRIFFLNILKKCPELVNDFNYPDMGMKFFKKLPVLFFGGEGSRVLLHYDIDMANNMHFNFHGKKEVILFPQEEKKYLYHVPHSIVAMEEIEFDKPDYEKFPALRKAQGYRTILNHGETLFIPSGYWHYIRYLSPSISLSLRSFPTSTKKRLELLKNLVLTMPYDNIMRKLQGQQWIDRKNKQALARTNKNIGC